MDERTSQAPYAIPDHLAHADPLVEQFERWAVSQDLRIERAVHLLKTSHSSVDEITVEVGYADGVTLRALLRRRLGRSVRETRRSL